MRPARPRPRAPRRALRRGAVAAAGRAGPGPGTAVPGAPCSLGWGRRAVVASPAGSRSSRRAAPSAEPVATVGAAAGPGASGAPPAGVGTAAVTGAAADAAAGAVGAGALPVGTLTAASALPLVCGNASRSLRATGASTVEDADFTNSPLSFSQARTVLLSTPSSLASSCTRALPATVLLRPARGAPRDLVLAHDGSHRYVLIACSSQSQLASCSDSVILVLPQAINQCRLPEIPGTGSALLLC